MLYMFLADGFEETEAIGALDVIRRGGLEIKTVGVTGETVTGSHGVEIKSDIMLCEADCNNIDGVILPGGMPGTTNLFENKTVIDAVKYCFENGKMLAAICAAPLVFGRLGMLKDRSATCYPGFENELIGAECVGSAVVRDGNIITAKGAGAALKFGGEIVSYFAEGKGEEILAQMQCE